MVMRTTKVLVVDDDPLLLRTYRRLLRGIEVVLAQGAERGRAALAADPTFDAVITDLNMPGTDGLSLYQSIAREHPRLAPRVIFCSGSGPDAVPRSLPNVRIQKPFSRADLRTALQSLPPVERYAGTPISPLRLRA